MVPSSYKGGQEDNYHFVIYRNLKCFTIKSVFCFYKFEVRGNKSATIVNRLFAILILFQKARWSHYFFKLEQTFVAPSYFHSHTILHSQNKLYFSAQTVPHRFNNAQYVWASTVKKLNTEIYLIGIIYIKPF